MSDNQTGYISNNSDTITFEYKNEHGELVTDPNLEVISFGYRADGSLKWLDVFDTSQNKVTRYNACVMEDIVYIHWGGQYVWTDINCHRLEVGGGEFEELVDTVEELVDTVEELDDTVEELDDTVEELDENALRKQNNLNDVSNKQTALGNLEGSASVSSNPSDYGYDTTTQQSKSNVMVQSINTGIPMAVPFKDFADTIVDVEDVATLEDVNSITAKYITSSAAGAAFADEAALSGDKYYAGQIITTSTSPALGNNDYCIVLDSGASHDNATARYVYQEGAWVFQYVVSQVTLNQAQLDALNSGITAAKVTKLDNLKEGYAFTYIVDSDVKLANWLNGVSGNDYSSVLVKTGTWNYNGIPLSLDDNSVNTKKITGEYNSVIHISADGNNDDVVGLKNGEHIYNIKLFVSNTGTSSAMKTYGFVSCDNLTNCSVIIDVDEVNSRVYGYYRCHKLLDCNAYTTGVLSVCFDECEELSRCEATANTYETIQGATGSMCFSLCRRLNYCKATANRGSSSPAAIGYHMCYGVTYCKAQSDDRLYQSSYSSLGAIDGYECSNSLNGGFNSNINDTIAGFLSPLGQVYAECSTDARTKIKQITATINSSLILVKGLKITVRFTQANTAANPAISIDGGNTSILIALSDGTAVDSSYASRLWEAGEIVDFIYDGTHWRIQKEITFVYYITYVAASGSVSKSITLPTSFNNRTIILTGYGVKSGNFSGSAVTSIKNVAIGSNTNFGNNLINFDVWCSGSSYAYSYMVYFYYKVT